MKIVILTPRVPEILDKGDKLRIFHQIKFLSTSNEIHLISLSTSKKRKVNPELKQYIKSFPEQINKKWHQICQMTDLVDDQTTMKLLAYTFLSGINYTNMYLNSNGSEHIKKNYIDGYSDLVRKFPVFNFEIGSYQLSHN